MGRNFPKHVQELLKGENYFHLPYDEDIYLFIFIFCVLVAVLAVMFNNLSDMKKKKGPPKAPAHVFESRAPLSAKDQVVVGK